MASTYLFDTDCLISLLQGDVDIVDLTKSIQAQSDSRMLLSEMSRLELLSNARLDDQAQANIDALVEGFDEVIDIDETISRKAAELRRLKPGVGVICSACGKRSGGKLKTPDSIIAASAISENALLVTRNLSDYEHLCDQTELELYFSRVGKGVAQQNTSEGEAPLI